ncbi:MAG: hypothetical protein ACE5G8_08270, partial [Anaerolineae bacterium]
KRSDLLRDTVDRVEIPLPPGLPPGEYAVRVGLYLPATGERLRMLYGEQNLPLDDFFSPGTVTVKQ